MLTSERTRTLLNAVGAIAFGAIALAGIVQSVRATRQLPDIDLIVSGPEDHIGTLIAKQDYQEAIAQLHIQAKLQPSDPATFEQLGVLLAKEGRPKEARTQFQSLVRLRPDYAQGFEYLGSTYLDTGEISLAARCFEKAIRLDPNFAHAHNDLGVAKARSGDIAEAEKHFATAVELDPDYESAKTNLNNARNLLRKKP